RAPRGTGGSGRDRTGARGRDLIVPVPAGTQILSEDRETVLADLTKAGDRVTLLEGGMGGRGNASYKTATNRAPRQSQPGEPYEEMWVWLRLKLLADAGLVGLPNAGKSTFIRAVSNAKAKVGNYPFTTVKPQLGVVEHREASFVLADIPGLIEGAAEGAGIGDRFLGHIERCRVLVHLIDASDGEPAAAWRTVRAELTEYGAGLAEKPELVALTKTDLIDEELTAAFVAELDAAGAGTIFPVSAATGAGMMPLLDAVAALAVREPAPAVLASSADEPEDAADWSPL
ncbi:MAG: GTPase ObgE, partial [Pseudomonadota bacterium]